MQITSSSAVSPTLKQVKVSELKIGDSFYILPLSFIIPTRLDEFKFKVVRISAKTGRRFCNDVYGKPTLDIPSSGNAYIEIPQNTPLHEFTSNARNG